MNSNTKIAVIMSVYKNDKLDYVKEALESIFCQTLKDFHIYIQLDGGIPNEIEAYLDECTNNGQIYSINKREANKGLAYSLNELLDIVLKENYTYIARMDADDICVKNRLELQCDYMDNNKNVDVCGGLIEEFNMDTDERKEIPYPEQHKDIELAFKKRNSIAHVTAFIRASFFEKTGVYNPERLNEDFDLWIRGLMEKCLYYNIQKSLVYVRTSNAFFKRRKNKKRAIEIMKLKMSYTKYKKFGISGYFYAIAHYVLFMMPGTIKIRLYKYLR